ncbi:MAG: hypothetical protein ACK5X3_17200, partial [Pseudomonadota bacterium]
MRSLSQVIDTYPFVEDFNTTNGAWIPSSAVSGNSWQHGPLPSGYATFSGVDGSQGSAWYAVANINSADQPTILQSPIFDFSGVPAGRDLVLEFDLKLSVRDRAWMSVDYQLNGNGNWITLGSNSDPSWYGRSPAWEVASFQPAFGDPISGFNGVRYSLAGWTRVITSLCALSGNSCVQFRLRYDPRFDGPPANPVQFAVDNFTIRENTPDISVTQILAPSSSGGGVCDLNSRTALRVRVRNNRCAPISNVPIRALLSQGGVEVQRLDEVVPGPIAGGGEVVYNFTSTLNLATVGTYRLDVLTNHYVLAGAPTNDQVAANDTSRISITVSVPFIDTFPYLADFNSSGSGWRNAPIPGLDNNWVYGPLPNNYAGFSGLDGSQGNGWYAVANSNSADQPASLLSPIFDLRSINDPTLSFDLKLSVRDRAWMSVDYQLNGNGSWITLGTNSDPNWYSTSPAWEVASFQPAFGDPISGFNGIRHSVSSWTRVSYDLCALSGNACVQFRLRYDPRFDGPPANPVQFAVDNFRIDNPKPYSVGITNIVAPGNGSCSGLGTAESVTIHLVNDGCIDVTNLPVSISLAGAGGGTLTGTIPVVPRKGAVFYTFPGTLNMSVAGDYTLTATITTPPVGDNNTADDVRSQTRTTTRIAINATTPSYTENFNANNGDFHLTQLNPAGNYWQHGPLPSGYATFSGVDGSQ